MNYNNPPLGELRNQSIGYQLEAFMDMHANLYQGAARETMSVLDDFAKGIIIGGPVVPGLRFSSERGWIVPPEGDETIRWFMGRENTVYHRLLDVLEKYHLQVIPVAQGDRLDDLDPQMVHMTNREPAPTPGKLHTVAAVTRLGFVTTEPIQRKELTIPAGTIYRPAHVTGYVDERAIL